jgi:hypothetical protein
MRKSNLSYVFAFVSVGVACNAVLGLEKLERQPPGGNAGEAGMSETGGTSAGGRGGASGSGQGGSSGRGGSSGASSGTAGEGGAGMGGGGTGGDCEPDDAVPCSEVDPSLLGNCREGEVVCQMDGTWGDCSVTPESADSCDAVGDDASCDGTPNGGCPCVTGTMRECGPNTEEGICEDGEQTCVNEVWGDCEGDVNPAARDCLSPNDNDCDGSPDNLRDADCPCAVDGAHACVEDAPVDWEGPMALATAAGSGSAPLCSGTGYERQVLSLFGGLDTGAQNCGCTCGTPAGMSCTQSICMHRTSTSQQCQLAGQNIMDTCEYTLSPGQCTASLPTGFYKPMYPTWTASGTCPAAPTVDIGTAVWTERMVACETNDADPAGCAALAQCMPELANPLDAWCIYRNGTHACPSGPYSEQTVYYAGMTDTRSCSACTCGSPTGICQGSVHFSYGNNLPGGCELENGLSEANFGGCLQVDGSYFAVGSPTTPQPMGSCMPQGGALQGSVTTSGAVTVCCKP